jgi:urea carboxylase
VPGNVWKLLKNEGDEVSAGDAVLIVESMKMEITIGAAQNGTIREFRVRPGQTVSAGQVVAVIEV